MNETEEDMFPGESTQAETLTQEEKVLMDDIDFSSDEDEAETNHAELSHSQNKELVDDEIMELIGTQTLSQSIARDDSDTPVENENNANLDNLTNADMESDNEDLFTKKISENKIKTRVSGLDDSPVKDPVLDNASSSPVQNNDSDNGSEVDEQKELEQNAGNKVLAAEIEAVKEIERGPTEAELRRMKLIELDPDEAEEKIERFKRLGTEAISKATGLTRQDRIAKLRSSRSFLASLWKSKQFVDVIETYVEKQLGRLFGDDDPPFDPISYLEQDTFSDEEEEKAQEKQAREEKKHEITVEANESNDMIALSDSEDEDEIETVASPQIVQPEPIAAQEIVSVPTKTTNSIVQRLQQQQQQHQQRKLFLAPVRVPRSSRAALMISLRQKVQQTATENYCHQKRIKQEELNQHLEIADQCRALIELLRDHFDEKEQKIQAERQARFATWAEDDEDAEFGDEEAMEEGKFLTDEERRRLYTSYHRHQNGYSSSDSDYDDEDEDVEDDDNEDKMDEEVEEEAAADEDNEVVQEELHVNEDLAAYDNKPELNFSPQTQTQEDAQEEEDVKEDEEDEIIPMVRKEKNMHARSFSALQDEDDLADDSQVPEFTGRATNKVYGRRPVKVLVSSTSAGMSEINTKPAEDTLDDAESLADSVEDHLVENAVEISADAVEADMTEPVEGDVNEIEDVEPTHKKEKKHKKEKTKINTGNALYRAMLEEEERRFRNHKRNALIDDEAEEEEEEGQQAGLGDFGFVNVSDMREAEAERRALQLHKGDLDHIVDEISDGEGDEEAEREALYQMELKEDRERTKMIVEAITEGHDAMRAKKYRRKQGYSFEALVTGRSNKTADGQGDESGDQEGANNAAEEEELDFEEMLQRGLSEKMEREKRRRYNDEDDDEDDDGEDLGEEGDEYDEDGNLIFKEGFVGENGEIWTEEMVQVERDRQQRERELRRAEFLRRKQMDKDFKMRRELRYQQMQRFQQQPSPVPTLQRSVSTGMSSSQAPAVPGLLPSSLPANARINPAILSRIAPSAGTSSSFAVPGSTSNSGAAVANMRLQRSATVTSTLRKIRSVHSASANGAQNSANPQHNNANNNGAAGGGMTRYSGELSRLELETGVGMVSTVSSLPTPTSSSSTPRGTGLFQMVTNNSSSSNNLAHLASNINAGAQALSKKRSFSALLHDGSRSQAPHPKRLARAVSTTAATTSHIMVIEANSLSAAPSGGDSRWSRLSVNESLGSNVGKSMTHAPPNNENNPNQPVSLFAKVGANNKSLLSRSSSSSINGGGMHSNQGGLKRTFSVMSTTTAQ